MLCWLGTVDFAPFADADLVGVYKVAPAVVDEELVAGTDIGSCDESLDETSPVHHPLRHDVILEAGVVDESVQGKTVSSKNLGTCRRWKRHRYLVQLP